MSIYPKQENPVILLSVDSELMNKALSDMTRTSMVSWVRDFLSETSEDVFIEMQKFVDENRYPVHMPCPRCQKNVAGEKYGDLIKCKCGMSFVMECEE